MARTKRSYFVVWIVAIAVVVGFIPLSTMAAEKPITIGLLTWMEGSNLIEGRQYTRAFKTAIKEINDNGGILGRKVKGIVGNNGVSADAAKTSLLKMVLKNKINAFVGPHWSFMQPVGLEIAQKYNLPFASLQGGHWLPLQKFPAYAVFCGNGWGNGTAGAKWIVQKGYKKVAMVNSELDYCHFVEDNMQEYWKDNPNAPEYLGSVWFDWGTTDITKEITQTVAKKPDLIWVEDWSDPLVVNTLKVLEDLGYKGDVIFTPVVKPSTIQNLPKELTENRGVYVAKEWGYDPNVPANKAFYDLFMEEWGEAPSYPEMVIYSSTTFLLKAMEAAGVVPDGSKAALDKVAKAMHSIKWITPNGVPANLSPGGMNLTSKMAYVKVEGGQFVLDQYVPMSPEEWLPQK